MLKPYGFLFRGEEMPTFATCLNITMPQKATRQITLLDLSVVVVVRFFGTLSQFHCQSRQPLHCVGTRFV